MTRARAGTARLLMMETSRLQIASPTITAATSRRTERLRSHPVGPEAACRMTSSIACLPDVIVTHLVGTLESDECYRKIDENIPFIFPKNPRRSAFFFGCSGVAAGVGGGTSAGRGAVGSNFAVVVVVGFGDGTAGGWACPWAGSGRRNTKGAST